MALLLFYGLKDPFSDGLNVVLPLNLCSEKIFQVGTHAEMHYASGEVVRSVAHIDPETVDFQSKPP